MKLRLSMMCSAQPGGARRSSPRPILSLALVLGVTAACAEAEPPARAADAGDTVVARSDSISLRVSDVERLLQALDPARREQLRESPQALSALLKQELQRRLLLRQAEAQKVEQRAEVRDAIERARREIVVSAFLKLVSEPAADFPSEAELQQAYRLNQERLVQPRQYRVAHIYLAVPAGAAATSEAARSQQTRAAQLARQLQAAPESFADVARKQSDEKASAAKGGELGWIAERQLAPEIRPVVAGLAKGQVSEPVFASGGWHVLRLLDTKAGETAPYEQVKAELRERLRQQQAQRTAAAYVARLLTEQHAAVDEIGLQRMLEASP